MIAPSLILIAVVAAYPIFYAVWLSLHEYSVITPGLSRWAGLKNYTDAFDSKEFRDSIKNTFVFTVFSVFFELAARPGDGADHAQRHEGQGPAAHGRADPVGGAHGRHGDHLADDLRAEPRAREHGAADAAPPGRGHRLARAEAAGAWRS